MLVHGVKGGVWDRSSHGTGQHPQHCQHHPQDADDAGKCGDHTIGGGGGGGGRVRGPGTGTYIRKGKAPTKTCKGHFVSPTEQSLHKANRKTRSKAKHVSVY